MLGRGSALPALCRFDGGGADGPLVEVKYVCPAGEVVVDLVHPSVAPTGAVETERFALMLRSGNPPPSLADALVSLIRPREYAFRWSYKIADGADAEGTEGDR